jgi:dethiobiotin synthetase
LPLAAAPLVAAEAAGTSIDLRAVVQTVERGVVEHRPGLLLVEGAGGWRVPITPTADMSTLSRELRLPVVVVARAGLGTINHTLLSVEAIERDGLAVAAAILSRRPEDNEAASERNRVEILRRWNGTVVILDGSSSALDPLL